MTKARSNATAPAAKGQIVVGTGTDASGTLSVGNAGETLVADSSTSTGLRWQAAVASGRNKLLNSDFTIWQRGTSFTANDIYTADRWKHYYGAGTWTMSRTTSNLPTGFQYGFNMVNSGTAASVFIAQTIETANAITLAGQTVTVSGYVRASTSGNFVINVGTSANTDEGSSGTFTTASATGNTWAATTTPTRFSAQFVIPSNTKTIRVEINSPNLGSGASATMTGFQIEVGSVATPFVTATGTLAGELAACQRYYYSIAGLNVNLANATGYSTTVIRAVRPHPVPMRGTPSFSASSGTSYYRYFGNNTSIGVSSITDDYKDSLSIQYNITTTGLTVGYSYWIVLDNASSKIEISAEL